MLVDLAIDIDTNDLSFKNSDLYFINNINYVRQKLKIRLQWFLGEWFLNTTLGLPYFTEILTKKPNRIAIVDYFKKVILETEGVQSLDNFSIEFGNIKNRIVQIIFTATTSYSRINFDEMINII
jgi:hypothetical protein